MGDYDEYFDDEYILPEQKQNRRIISGLYFVAPILLTGIAALGYGYYTYGSFAKVVEETQKKVKIPLTTTPVPLDWREVEIEDLKPTEMDKVQSYAIAQATFDILSACVVLISLMFMLSFDQTKELLDKQVFALFFAILTCSAALYSIIFTYNTGVYRRTPVYVKWWYGNEYERFTPWNMIGTMGAAAAVISLICTFKIVKVSDLKSIYNTDKTKFYMLVMIGIYIIHSFYGSYLTKMVKQSEYFEPYLNYLYPFVVSCAIALLTYKATDNIDTGFVTLLACCALIAFRSFGQNNSFFNLVADMSFWTDLFGYVLAVVAIIAIISLRQGKLGQRAKGAHSFGQKGLSRITSSNRASIFIAALVGSFLFFSMQLFWTTTMVLGDAAVAAMSSLVLLIVANDIPTYSKDIQKALYSGCLVTGLLWMNMYSQQGFQALSKK